MNQLSIDFSFHIHAEQLDFVKMQSGMAALAAAPLLLHTHCWHELLNKQKTSARYLITSTQIEQQIFCDLFK